MSKMNPRMLGGAIAAATLVGLGLMAVPADAATFTVTTTADVVDGGDSDLSLREAVDAANASAGDDEIDLPAGIHALTIPGAGANNDNAGGDLDHLGTGQLTIRGAGLDVTYIDAAGLSDRILDMRDGALVLEDLTIRNGDVDAGGGAVRATGSLTATRIAVTDNASTDSGGGGLRVVGSATITASRLDGNDSGNNGGAVRVAGGATIVDSVFTGNTAAVAGGALYSPGAVNLTRTTFDANTTGANGGAVWTTDSVLTITNSTFRANGAGGNGGAVRAQDPTTTITGSTFTGNTAPVAGGAIRQRHGSTSITNSTFDANTAADGGALWMRDITATLTHVTVAGGGSTGDGAVRAAAGSNVTFASTVIAPALGNACTMGGIVNSAGSNAATDASCDLSAGSDQDGTAVPDLQALADNGGTTLTRLPGPNSTLTDAATCAAAADQRGIARPEGAQCEIGAVELRIPVPQPDSATTPQDAAINVDVADNDTVYDGHVDLTSAATTAGPTNGSTTDVGDGTITYTPLPGWWGTDTFTYELCGPSESVCNTAVATITVVAAPTTTTSTTVPPTTAPPTTVPPTTVPPTTTPPTTSPATTVPTQAKPDSQNQTPTATSLPATGATHAEQFTILAAAFLFVGMTVLLVSSGARRHPSRAVFRPQHGGWTRN